MAKLYTRIAMAIVLFGKWQFATKEKYATEKLKFAMANFFKFHGHGNCSLRVMTIVVLGTWQLLFYEHGNFTFGDITIY